MSICGSGDCIGCRSCAADLRQREFEWTGFLLQREGAKFGILMDHSEKQILH